MARDDGPTWVYHCMCEHHGTLYVGIASDLRKRLRQHRRTKVWWSHVATVIADRYPSRHEARAVELATIRRTLPPHNIEGYRWGEPLRDVSELPVPMRATEGGFALLMDDELAAI